MTALFPQAPLADEIKGKPLFSAPLAEPQGISTAQLDQPSQAGLGAGPQAMARSLGRTALELTAGAIEAPAAYSTLALEGGAGLASIAATAPMRATLVAESMAPSQLSTIPSAPSLTMREGNINALNAVRDKQIRRMLGVKEKPVGSYESRVKKIKDIEKSITNPAASLSAKLRPPFEKAAEWVRQGKESDLLHKIYNIDPETPLLEKIKDPRWWLEDFTEGASSAVAFLVFGMTASKGAKALGATKKQATKIGASVAGGMIFVTETGSSYNEIKRDLMEKYNMPEPDAAVIASRGSTAYGLVAGLIERGLFPVQVAGLGTTTKGLRGWLMRMFIGGTGEVTEEEAQYVLMGLTRYASGLDPNLSFEGAAETGIMAAGGGLAISSLRRSETPSAQRTVEPSVPKTPIPAEVAQEQTEPPKVDRPVQQIETEAIQPSKPTIQPPTPVSKKEPSKPEIVEEVEGPSEVVRTEAVKVQKGRMLRAELVELTDDQLEQVRQENTDVGTRRTAKKILKERGVGITTEGKREGITKAKPKGKVFTDPRELSDTEEMEISELSESLEDVGATRDARSESGSRYYTLPSGQKVRISNHPPNQATLNWMSNNNVADLQIGSGAEKSQLAELLTKEPTEAVKVQKEADRIAEGKDSQQIQDEIDNVVGKRIAEGKSFKEADSDPLAEALVEKRLTLDIQDFTAVREKVDSAIRETNIEGIEDTGLRNTILSDLGISPTEGDLGLAASLTAQRLNRSNSPEDIVDIKKRIANTLLQAWGRRENLDPHLTLESDISGFTKEGRKAKVREFAEQTEQIFTAFEESLTDLLSKPHTPPKFTTKEPTDATQDQKDQLPIDEKAPEAKGQGPEVQEKGEGVLSQIQAVDIGTGKLTKIDVSAENVGQSLREERLTKGRLKSLRKCIGS